MALEEKIVEWANKQPGWQRYIMRRVAAGEALDYDELEGVLVEGSPIEKVDLELKHLPQAVPGDPPVQMVSVANPEHVNALESPQPLTFGPKGLTLVYGDNASGKSGYARILKGAVHARAQETDVLSDVFNDTADVTGKADLTVQVGDKDQPVSWPVRDMPELRRMRFYDAACGDAYIDTESDFPYKPSALLVMEGLIAACDKLWHRLDEGLTENLDKRKDLPAADEACKNSNPAKFLESLSGSSTVEELDALLAKRDPARIDELKKRERRLNADDPTREQERLRREAERLDAVLAHITKLDEALGVAAVADLRKQREAVQALEAASALLARQFGTEPLAGVGSQTWRDLWDSARMFSEEAYPQVPFPATAGDSRCVLCLQELDADARDRFLRFESFVRDDTQAKLAAARNKWARAISRIRELECQPELTTHYLKDLSADHAALVGDTKALLRDYEEGRTAILDAVDTASEIPKKKLDTSELKERLATAAATDRETAAKLGEPEGIEEQLEKCVEARTTLELLETMSEHRADIQHEIQRRKEQCALEEAKNATLTSWLTRKMGQFSEEEITEVVRTTFVGESTKLRLKRISLTKGRPDKGALYHKPRLVGAKQRVTPRQVFSEGEKTALGLAAFFTEAELDGSRSALILDDPVSSLDHVRTGVVAGRLASFGKTRQVIVFTHNVAFVTDLKREADREGIAVTERSVCQSVRDERPGKCETKLPWHIKEVPERLDDLRRRLAILKRGGLERDEYDDRVALWAGRLSQVWERIFAKAVIGRILVKGGTELQPKMVRILAKFSEDDDREFQASYSQVSGWAARHDQHDPTNYRPPTVDMLDTELQRVEAWYKRVMSYQ